ncbi:TonB-dependent receptor domain-containing protein [Qipengyuania spongiae]|uniref:TonB-dependent receptor n=1 Tax=Qipengyuania spongiae TaxID=2909673 RepID=A0ABY5T0V0_9SPHN|nr:TonB-dependent receptor [Qipengyuania spongiae]UVI40422.1 TonB-dependent receptor [Qipengyuania spongiae]
MKTNFAARGGRAALCASVGLAALVLSAPGFAQDTSSVEDDDPETLGQNETELESGQQATSTGTIVVTGSRIRDPGVVSSVPVTSLGVQDLLDGGDLTVGDALNQLPALRSTFSQANSTRFIGTAGLNLLDLRGLGSERTLVLVNGRRHVTSTPGDFRVDTNTIPVDLLERTDVITGANSAIYGSDAVAGVVNFVLKEDFEGIKLRGQGGISDRGDRGSYFVSGVAGKNFADNRGNIAFAAEYARNNPVFFADRPDQTGAFNGAPGFNTVDTDIQCADTNGDGTPDAGSVPFCDPAVVNNSDGIFDTRFFENGTKFGFISLGGTTSPACPAATATNAARRAAVCTGETSPTGGRLGRAFVFLPDGSLVADPITADLRSVGGGRFGGLTATGLEGAMLLPGLERYAGNLLFNFEVSPAFRPFAEAKYVRIEANQTSTQPTFVAGALSPVFSTSNPFLTPQARAQLNLITGGAATFSLNRFNNDIGTRAEDHERETYRIVGGVRGDFGPTSNFFYEVALNYGRTDTFYETGGNVLVDNFNNAANAVRNGAGQIVCGINADADPTNDDAACVPINLFGQGAPSAAAIDYVLYTSSREERAEQFQAVASLSGTTETFFELPGGPVSFAVGAEYRRETAFTDYDDVTQSGATFLNAFDTFDPPALKVAEAFGEVRLPILADRPFFEELSVQAAGRVSDYDALEDLVFTYNVGAVYAPIQDVRFRVSYGRSVRAPNLNDLYATRAQTFANNFQDPCDQRFINDNPNRAARCAEAGIPTQLTLPDGSVVPFTNAPTSGISGFNQGNINLEPEVSNSLTIGAVFQPRFLPGFSLTVDYYDVEITQAIAGLSGQGIVNRCYDDPVTLDNPFCDAVFRRRSSNPLIDFTFDGQSGRRFAGLEDIVFPIVGPGFLNQPFNFQSLQASGIDFDAVYRTGVTDDVDLSLRAIVTHVIKRRDFTFISDPDRATRLEGVVGDPEWAGNFSANLDFGQFDIGYDLRFLDRQTIGAWEQQNSFQGRPPENVDVREEVRYPRQFYHDVRVRFEVNDEFNFYGGVDNLTDELPPFGATGTGGATAIFPVQGRTFYAGAEVTF